MQESTKLNNKLQNTFFVTERDNAMELAKMIVRDSTVIETLFDQKYGCERTYYREANRSWVYWLNSKESNKWYVVDYVAQLGYEDGFYGKPIRDINRFNIK